jgi:hypothetical protein
MLRAAMLPVWVILKRFFVVVVVVVCCCRLRLVTPACCEGSACKIRITQLDMREGARRREYVHVTAIIIEIEVRMLTLFVLAVLLILVDRAQWIDSGNAYTLIRDTEISDITKP